MATSHSGYSSVGRASGCRLRRNQMVPGSIPGGPDCSAVILLAPPQAAFQLCCLSALVSCLSIPLSAEGLGGQYFGKCGAGWFRRFFYTNLVELLLFKKNALNHPAPCSLWPQAIPAIAQLVEHLAVDCAEIRWSLARFLVGRIALLSSSWHLHRQRFSCAVCQP